MSDELTVIGRAEHIDLPELGFQAVPARIDTGARTSALWVSDIHERAGWLEFKVLGNTSEQYTGEVIRTQEYGRRLVSNSTGHVEERFTVRTLAIVGGRKVRATFTLANRASQVYPVLLGRNILRGKFIVDVTLGTPLVKQEQLREAQKATALQKSVRKDES